MSQLLTRSIEKGADRPVTMYEGVGDEPVDIQTGIFGNNFMLRLISTATPIYVTVNVRP